MEIGCGFEKFATGAANALAASANIDAAATETAAPKSRLPDIDRTLGPASAATKG
jgi:hypothetical protein